MVECHSYTLSDADAGSFMNSHMSSFPGIDSCFVAVADDMKRRFEWAIHFSEDHLDLSLIHI